LPGAGVSFAFFVPYSKSRIFVLLFPIRARGPRISVEVTSWPKVCLGLYLVGGGDSLRGFKVRKRSSAFGIVDCLLFTRIELT